MTREELLKSRKVLLERSGMSWDKLKSLGESFQLDDDNYSIYKTIKSYNWVLEGK